jgi:homoprotocatechuate degradation regulator HpaR
MAKRRTGASDNAADGANPSRMPPFNRSLPMQLMQAREAVMQRFRPHLHARGLTDQQWRIIRALVEVKSYEIFELSARCVIHPASLSRILPKLDADGLITRVANAEDQRRVIVSITPAGRKLFETVAPESERIYAEIAAAVGPEKLEQIYEVLEDLIGALDEKKSTKD